MAFKLSGRSLNKLEGVHPTMVDTVKRAIEVSKVDFGVIYGVRSLAEQKKLYEAKSSLLYTSDAADDKQSVDLRARRIIKKK